MEKTNKTGVTFNVQPFTIERGKIKEFALAIGDKNEIYYDVKSAREQGFRDIPIPPTFPTVIEMWSGLSFETLIKELELDPLKVLHGEQEYEYLEDICAGDEISCVAKVISHTEKRRMNFITIENRFFRNDNLVLIARSNIIER
ncbi:MaoC family dehydratase N-terminal domain-containing protein [Bacillus sp. FJAT-49736]|uniref:FAS1-like dehydratase domain-containing protein n=1 Tax=Bacillus sp. FJAT-49736 TaxID=2833582 RepID=UPI001BC92116|nr:MaoC family dehydratase N-terminal domain-containing protein [Bacillus sp. FJAT-49736]MBS4172967.1 MaoC family dehydratase N-terminal domain-containing protein [Bacillus sp. FJAT-49736]